MYKTGQELFQKNRYNKHGYRKSFCTCFKRYKKQIHHFYIYSGIFISIFFPICGQL